VATYHGVVDAQYRAEPDGSRITLQARIRGPGPAGRTLARFRHPDRKPLRRVLVNGRRWSRFDPASEDVDLTSLAGRIAVVAAY
jgi:hypothetical protein